ncbi:MAG: AcvB/VirJ family lysyl-phosphatidylglycerol hydrolase [Gemmatimonadota bacterium]
MMTRALTSVVESPDGRPIPVSLVARFPAIGRRAQLACAISLLVLLGCVRAGAQEHLPIVEVAPSGSQARLLAVLVSGDGDWSAADRAVADSLHRRGVAVVGLKARAYLRSDARSPDGFAADLAGIAERHLELWGASELIFVGYSRGASIGPFALTRWPPTLRERLRFIALLDPESTANFAFHWIDLVRDVPRAGDLQVLPELERLRGIPMLCVYGTGESASLCANPPRELFVSITRPGGHRIDDSPEPGRFIVEELARLGILGGGG